MNFIMVILLIGTSAWADNIQVVGRTRMGYLPNYQCDCCTNANYLFTNYLARVNAVRLAHGNTNTFTATVTDSINQPAQPDRDLLQFLCCNGLLTNLYAMYLFDTQETNGDTINLLGTNYTLLYDNSGLAYSQNTNHTTAGLQGFEDWYHIDNSGLITTTNVAMGAWLTYAFSRLVNTSPSEFDDSEFIPMYNLSGGCYISVTWDKLPADYTQDGSSYWWGSLYNSTNLASKIPATNGLDNSHSFIGVARYQGTNLVVMFDHYRTYTNYITQIFRPFGGDIFRITYIGSITTNSAVVTCGSVTSSSMTNLTATQNAPGYSPNNILIDTDIYPHGTPVSLWDAGAHPGDAVLGLAFVGHDMDAVKLNALQGIVSYWAVLEGR